MMTNRKNKSKNKNTQSTSSSSNAAPSESDDAFAAAAAAAAAAATAADVATLSGWDSNSQVGGVGSVGGGSSSNRSVGDAAAAAAAGGVGSGSGGGDNQPDAISHSARLALSNSIRHHANLLRDADQTIQGFDDENTAQQQPANTEGSTAEGGVGVFDALARRVRGGVPQQQDEESGGGATAVPAYAAGSNNSLLSHRSKSSQGGVGGDATPIPPQSAFMGTSQSSLQSSSIQSQNTNLSTFTSSPSTLYTLVPKALLFRAILAVLSLGVALALAIFHGGGRLGLEVSSMMFEKTILDGRSYGVAEQNIQGEEGMEEEDNSGTIEDSSSSTSAVITDNTLDIPNLAEMNLVIPPVLSQNLAELTPLEDETTTTTTTTKSAVHFVPDDGVPLFWQIPSSGSNVIKHILGKCFGVVEASEVGAGHNEADLQVFETDDGTRYVNVDTTTYAGLTRASTPSINLASSGLPNLVIFTPLLHPASTIFTSQYTAKFFTLFRHPVDRVVSHYHHLQKIDMSIQDMTITQYAQSGRVENNYITRSLINKMGGGLTQEDANIAMDIIRRKCVVGLVDHIEESMNRFEEIFGWNGLVETAPGVKECRDHHLISSFSHHERQDFRVEEGSDAWNIIMMHNQYDYQVYKYAQYLFWTRTY